jgi:hypothetical protein
MPVTQTLETRPEAAGLGYPAFDADSHYYESTDALTRHLPKAMARRGPKWAEIGGRKRLMLGD